MKRLQVLVGDNWEYVFCRNPRLSDPVTTKDPEKAIPAHQHSLQYMKHYFGNHHFQYSDEMIVLNLELYFEAFKNYPSHKNITGGTIHDFLKESKVVYYGGKCPIYQIEHFYNGNRCVIGGNYATNGKPLLSMGNIIDFN